MSDGGERRHLHTHSGVCASSLPQPVMTPYFLQAWGRNPGVPWAGGLQATSQKVQPTPAPPRTCEPALQLASTPFLPEQMVLPHLHQGTSEAGSPMNLKAGVTGASPRLAAL